MLLQNRKVSVRDRMVASEWSPKSPVQISSLVCQSMTSAEKMHKGRCIPVANSEARLLSSISGHASREGFVMLDIHNCWETL
ncbi:hypothetical protein KCU90_g19, partial [Aureobasidium melanogenum]